MLFFFIENNTELSIIFPEILSFTKVRIFLIPLSIAFFESENFGGPCILIPQTLIHFPEKIIRRRSFFRSVTGFNESKNSR